MLSSALLRASKFLEPFAIFRTVGQMSTIEPIEEAEPLEGRELAYDCPYRKPLRCFVENLRKVAFEPNSIVDLHPDVWAVNPRIDILHQNVRWQQLYRRIDDAWTPKIFEMSGGKRKPWPQKGTGRARQGSRRAPQWRRGYVVNGPRGPTSFYYMLPKQLRVDGLCTALTVKYHQNNLHIVDDFDLLSDDPEFLKDVMQERMWGYSALFVDDADVMPLNISAVVGQSRGLSLMPVYGLNVYSMLKHDTLVLTLRALDKIEEKLLFQKHSTQPDDLDKSPLFNPPKTINYE